MRYLINKNPSSRNLFIFLKFEEIITIQSKNLGFVFSLTDISAPTIKGRKSYALHVWDKTNKPRKITSSPINATICFCLEKEIPVAQTLIKFLSRVIWFCLFVFLWMWLHRFEWRARELVEEVIYWWCVCVHSYESVSGIQMGQVSKNPYLPSKEYLWIWSISYLWYSLLGPCAFSQRDPSFPQTIKQPAEGRKSNSGMCPDKLHCWQIYFSNPQLQGAPPSSVFV
jgi:hypothetical protein